MYPQYLDCHEADAALKGILARGQDLRALMNEEPGAESVEEGILNLLERVRAASETITGGDRYRYGALEWRGRATMSLLEEVFGASWDAEAERFSLADGARTFWLAADGEAWTCRVVKAGAAGATHA
jgi:hypothetical protein